MAEDKNNKKILVLGATGNQGGAVTGQLLSKRFSVRVFTRNPESTKGRDLKNAGAEVMQGDLTDMPSVERALDGIWGVFAVFTGMEKGIKWEEDTASRFINSAKKAGVQHFVYSSVASADRKTGVAMMDTKARIEEMVKKTGFSSFAIIRPVSFMENYLSPMAWQNIEKGRLTGTYRPNAKMQLVAVEDIGRIGLMCFERYSDMNKAAFDFAGDEKTMPEIAEIMTKALGWKVEYVQTPIEDLRKMSPDFAALSEWVDKTGYDVNIPQMTRKYGMKLLTFEEWAGSKANWPRKARSSTQSTMRPSQNGM
jgi:uncharacterized protein YbjT (DUF2867 family)